jgi:hypothetical protein
MKKNLIAAVLFLAGMELILNSCTKVVELNLGNAAGQLDIEANLTNINGAQTVRLSTNVPFSNTNAYPPVTGATVVMKDQTGKSYLLTEGPQGLYASGSLTGIAGNTYTLSVLADGQAYSATSIMPPVVNLDSLSDKNRPLNHPQNGKDQKVISVYYQDPPGVANQYRFILWVNGVQVKSIFSYDDQLTDGRYITSDLLEQDIDIYAGDTVKIEMQCIDRPVYTYWFTLESQQANNVAGAVAPANPPTNISPATLGYFSAHTTQTMTLIVK